MGLLGQPGDQDLVCHLILVQSSFGIYESSSQNAQEGHKFRAAFAVHHSIECGAKSGHSIRFNYQIW